MALVRQLLRRPRSTWLWKANFQVHLWIGLLLTLYLIVMGVSGSILVLRTELERWTGERQPFVQPGSPQADPDKVVADVRAAYPSLQVISLQTPGANRPLFLTTVQGRYGRIAVKSDPASGAVLGVLQERRTWLDFLADLHATWLVGIRGRVANGVGAALLLLVNLTGLWIWWPGTKLWKRGLIVSVRRSWRRINYDLHRATGFWAIGILSFWAVSGIYFGWPRQFLEVINKVSPVVSASPPAVHVAVNRSGIRPSLSGMVASAYTLDPGTSFAGVIFPYSRRSPFEILLQRPGGRGREYTDTLYFNPSDGSHIATWRYGVNQSLGDWIIWAQIPFHFGRSWGFGWKLVWAALGLSVPVLAVTGAVLYWNRVLRRLIRL